MQPAPQRHALAFIFVTVLIDMIGFGIVMPVLPRLIMDVTGDTLIEAARHSGWLALAYAGMQFLFGPVMGNLSDRFGRRPVLITSLLVFAADYALMGFAPTLAWLFVGRLLAGITGASFTTAYAYVADISPPEKRAQNFGLLGMAFGIGFIIGPALGGLLGSFGTRVPFFAAAGLALANAVYGLLVLKESLPPEKRRRFELSRANPVGALQALRRQHGAVLWLAAAIFVWQVGHHSLPGTWAFFAIERFGWSEAQIGVSLAAVGVSAAIVGGGLTRVIIPRLGEHRAVVLGIWSIVAALMIYAFVPYGWAMYVGIAVGELSGLVYPSLNAMLSRDVDASSQGELQGAVASLSSLSTIIGPPLMVQVFAYFSSPAAPAYVPGAAFVLAALLSLAALALAMRAERRAVPRGIPSS